MAYDLCFCYRPIPSQIAQNKSKVSSHSSGATSGGDYTILFIDAEQLEWLLHLRLFHLLLLLWYSLQIKNSEIVCTLKKHIWKKIWVKKKLNETDTSSYFLTVAKVTVSLPTKCLRNPMSGSAWIGD